MLSTWRKYSVLVCLALSLCCTRSSAQVKNDDAAWQMFTTRLLEKINGGAAMQGLQVVTVPYEARWNEQKYGNYYAWRVLADEIPKWQPSYSTTQRLITDEYGLFIQSIELPLADPSKRAEAEAARLKWLAAADTLQTAWKEMPGHWTTYNDNQKALPPNRQMSFDSWFAAFDGKKIGSLRNNVDAAGQKYASYMAKAYKGYQLAAAMITSYDNPAYQLQAESPDGLNLYYRTYNITPDLGQWVTESKELATKGANPAITFDFVRNTGMTHSEFESAGGSVSYGGFLGANGGHTRQTVDTNRQGFLMHFEAVSFAQFTITPSPWFSGTLVTLFQKGPFVSGSVVGDGSRLFGPDGSFSLMPKTVYVVFRPKVKASLTSNEYHFLKEAWSGGGSISIGPFSFGASYNRTVEHVTWDDTANTVTAESSSDIPQVIATLSNVLPAFK